MDRSKFVAELERVMLTEEKMVLILLDLCDPASLPSEIPEEKRKEIMGYLLKLRDESRRHEKMVAGLIAKYSGGHSDGNGSAAN